MSGGGERLIGRPWRAVAALAAVASAVAMTVLALRYSGTAGPGRVDRAVDRWVIRHVRGHHGVALWFADLGGPLVVVSLTVLLVAVAVVLRRPRGAALAVLTPSIACAVTEWVVKPLVGRTKGDYLAYPSGHATGAFAVALVTVVLLSTADGRGIGRATYRAVSVVVLGLALACGVGLIASGYHYASDVVGGLLVALATTFALALALDRVAGAAGSGLTPASGSPTGRGRPGGTA